MAIKKENLPEFLRKLHILYSNMQEFLNKVSISLTSTDDYIDVNYQNLDGTTSTTKIPGLGYMKSEITAINNEMDSLINANDETITLRYKDGSVKNFEMKRLSALIDDLESIQDRSFNVPSDFRVKNNWFFESFLNPLLFISIEIEDFLDSGVDRFAVKRVIVNPQLAEDIDFFDENIKNRTDIDLDTLLTELGNAGIVYTIDDNVVELPTSINRLRGNFSVIKVFDEQIIENEESYLKRKYQLDKLSYIDVIDSTNNVKYLEADDVLITGNDSEYKVISVNRDTNIVVLERVFGNDVIAIGARNLKIRPEPYKVPELQINVGYDERQVIFVRPISKTLDLTTDKLSKGFAVYTNELTIALSNDLSIDLQTYYQNYVSDFGMLFLNFTKEKQMPAVVGEVPDAPLLSAENFQVININSHIKEDKAIQDLRDKISAKEKLKSEIDELNKTINKLKTKLNTSDTINDAERLKLKNKITDSVNEKNNLVTQYATLISEITLGLRTQAQFKAASKYRVRGFWEIPAPKASNYGDQTIIQFILSYRYISKKGTASNVNQLKYLDQDGNSVVGFFSNWVEKYSKILEKELNDDGIYVWVEEDPQDPDLVNINQLEIPITKGESVEIRVKSVSEAGYPINPIKSAWSESIIIDFPEELETTEEDEALAERINQEETLVKFQKELDARYLDLHLLNTLITGDKYYAHRSEDIMSGLFNSDGSIMNLYQFVIEVQDKIRALESAIQRDMGVIKVDLIDPDGNILEIKNGDSVTMFAGYYKDDIKNVAANQTISFRHGEVITKAYTLSISNTSQTPLELASRIAGGIDDMVPANTLSTVDEDYKVNRKYDLVPLSIVTLPKGKDGGFKHKAPFQSGQVKSQFAYARHIDYGLSNELYASVQSLVTNYDYHGRNVGGDLVPYNEGHYLPYDPMWGGGGQFTETHPQVWDGTYSGTVADGGGYISEFCIHTSHPVLDGTSWTALFKPEITSGGTQGYLNFAHGLYFDFEEDKTNNFNVDYYAQVEYRRPDPVAASGPGAENNYPIKLGFDRNDKYLIGKYTCGAYLFMAPSKYADISIEGNHPRLAKKQIAFGSENALNIPIIFQYRCSDILEYVGGYRLNEKISNIAYAKKIGIDIYLKTNTQTLSADYGDLFSFDVEIGCKYDKDLPTLTPVAIPSRGSLKKINFTEIPTRNTNS